MPFPDQVLRSYKKGNPPPPNESPTTPMAASAFFGLQHRLSIVFRNACR